MVPIGYRKLQVGRGRPPLPEGMTRPWARSNRGEKPWESEPAGTLPAADRRVKAAARGQSAGGQRPGGRGRQATTVTPVRWPGDQEAGGPPPAVRRSTPGPPGPRGLALPAAGIGRRSRGGRCTGDRGPAGPRPAACLPPACRGYDADRCRHRQVRSRLRRETSPSSVEALSRAAMTRIVPPQRGHSS